LDSNHAVLEVERETGIKLKVLGIKDAKAATEQYATSHKTKNSPTIVKTRNALVSLKGFARIPLTKDLLRGNEFRITVSNPRSSEISSFVDEIDKIPNFYGLQRFGSERLVTHLIGRQIVKRNFGKAIELILSYTTEYESPFSVEIRNMSRDPSNYPRLLRQLPKGMDTEYEVMSALMDGKGPVAAIRCIPIRIRRLFVHAYQAYIFNKCLSNAVLDGEGLSTAKPGDLCFESPGPLIFGKIKKFNPDIDSVSKTVPAVRLVGYTFQPGKGRLDVITTNIMQQESVTPRDFYIKEMDELSSPGGFRQSKLGCSGFMHQGSLSLFFKLPKGSYATTLLRELMKPEDPIKSGF
jgi:tRNA pseudouridine13 synthase